MRRLGLAAGALATLVFFTGCGSGPYADVLKDQLDAQKELTRILGTVTDEPSMAAAKQQLLKKYKAFERIREKALTLPKPSARVVKQLKEELGPQMEESIYDLQREIRRIKDLPGGKEFLDDFSKLSDSTRKKYP